MSDRKYAYAYPAVPQVTPTAPHKCRRFEGKHVLLTAATHGMGLAMATRFAEEGARISLSSRKQDSVDAAVEKLRELGHEVSGIVCHQAKEKDRRRFIEFAVAQYGKIHAVVLCAGVQPGAATGPTLDVHPELYDKIFDVNVKSFWSFTRDAMEHLSAGASFVFVSSVAAYKPDFPLGLYGVSKCALVAFTRLMAAELGPSGFRFNCIAPGIVRTKFSSFLWDTGEDGKDLLRERENEAFLRRLAEPWEMAGAAAFLCSRDASYITGQTVLMDGGTHSRM